MQLILFLILSWYNSFYSSNHPGAKQLALNWIESILPPKQQRRPLPSLLSLSFFYALFTATVRQNAVCHTKEYNPNQCGSCGPSTYHCFTLTKIILKQYTKKLLCIGGLRLFYGSNFSQSCGPGLDHRPRKLYKKQCVSHTRTWQFLRGLGNKPHGPPPPNKDQYS